MNEHAVISLFHTLRCAMMKASRINQFHQGGMLPMHGHLCSTCSSKAVWIVVPKRCSCFHVDCTLPSNFQDFQVLLAGLLIKNPVALPNEVWNARGPLRWPKILLSDGFAAATCLGNVLAAWLGSLDLGKVQLLGMRMSQCSWKKIICKSSS